MTREAGIPTDALFRQDKNDSERRFRPYAPAGSSRSNGSIGG
jgi:hypothetical protein